MPAVAWDKLFVFTVSPLELFVRGSCVYLLVFCLMRLFRREPGTVGIADLLMVVLIADAAQNGMSAEYKSLLDGFALILTIVFWNYALDWITIRSRWIERFTYPSPILLVENGSPIRRNMQKQFVTHEQLMSVLRQHGIENLSDVKAAYLEGSGHTSVIPHDAKRRGDTDTDREHHRVG